MPYISFTEEQKVTANSVELADFLRMRGEKIERAGREYKSAVHLEHSEYLIFTKNRPQHNIFIGIKNPGVITMMTMCAVVLETGNRQLLVRDSKNDQEIAVNTRCNCNFRVGDRVIIFHSGAMTRSIPPQISAIRIRKAPFNTCF